MIEVECFKLNDEKNIEGRIINLLKGSVSLLRDNYNKKTTIP